MPTVIENYHEFAARHSHDGKPVKCDGRTLFADGASVDSSSMMRREPPVEPVALLKVKRYYVDSRIKQEIADFDNFKYQCQEQAGLALKHSNVPGPPHDAADQLRRGAFRIETLQQQLHEIDKQLADTSQADAKRIHQDLQQESRQHLLDQLSDIQSVGIKWPRQPVAQ